MYEILAGAAMCCVSPDRRYVPESHASASSSGTGGSSSSSTSTASAGGGGSATMCTHDAGVPAHCDRTWAQWSVAPSMFVDNNDMTVTDLTTGLLWEKD